MKTKYEIKDTVWIHVGEKNLVQGTVVQTTDLSHLGEDPTDIIYIIQIESGVEPVYEARKFHMISPDEQGPINMFRMENHKETNRMMKKMGMPLPQGVEEYEFDENEPTSEEIEAALARSEQHVKHQALTVPQESNHKPKKRYYKKRKQ